MMYLNFSSYFPLLTGDGCLSIATDSKLVGFINLKPDVSDVYVLKKR